jgi:glucan 1,3-beta-glucosidase
VLAGLVFAAAHHARRLAGAAAIGPGWGAVALNAAVAGVLAGWTIENVPIESLDIGGWLRSLSFAALAIAAPIAGAAAMVLPVGPPDFARIIGAKSERARDRWR